MAASRVGYPADVRFDILIGPMSGVTSHALRIRRDRLGEFIKTGDSNGPGLPNWPAVTKAPAMTMEIGDKNAPIPVAGMPNRLAFFEKFFGRQRPAGTR